MKLDEALKIVLELAQETILDEKQIADDPEVLGPMVAQQREACEVVNTFLTSMG